MVDAGYVFVACLFIVLAIIVHLVRRYDKAWIAKDLHRGDLQALAAVANGKRFGVARDRFVRLARRGFAAEDAWGGCRITLKGRYANFISGVPAATDGQQGAGQSSY
jgi:hypothetical protein